MFCISIDSFSQFHANNWLSKIAPDKAFFHQPRVAPAMKVTAVPQSFFELPNGVANARHATGVAVDRGDVDFHLGNKRPAVACYFSASRGRVKSC
jgi:hypothetical protein